MCRVSSQATTSASRSAASTRSVTSSRLPIGVAHRRRAARLPHPQRSSGKYRVLPCPPTHEPSRRSTPATARGGDCCPAAKRTAEPGSHRPASARPERRDGADGPAERGRGASDAPPGAALAPLDQTEADRPHAARARRLLARCSRSCCSCSARSSSARPCRRTSPAALDPAGFPLTSANNILVLGSDRRQKDSQGTGRRNHGPGPLGHDHADPHRRRARGAAVDPARHGRRNPRARPAEDQRRARVRRAGRVDLGDRELARHPDQPRGRSQLRKLPAADRRDGRRQLHRRLHRLQARRRRRPTAASRCACPPAPTTSTASRRSRWRARARTCARRTRPTSSARNTSRRCSTT